LYEASTRLNADYDERDVRMLVELLGRFRRLIGEHTTVVREAPPRLHITSE
jgi:hypothetical protein